MSENSSTKKRKREEIQDTSSTTEGAKEKMGFFGDTMLYILPSGIGKVRTELFHKQIQKYHGKISPEFSEEVSHLVVDDNMDYARLCRILKVDEIPEHITVVKSLWLSRCLKELSVIPVEEFQLRAPPKPKEDRVLFPEPAVPEKCKEDVHVKSSKPEIADDSPSTSKYPKVGEVPRWSQKSPKGPKGDNSDADSDYVDSGDEETAPESPTINRKRPLPKGNWVCARSSADSTTVNHNKHITEKLDAMVKIYESTNDTWRAISYKKAIAVLKKQPKPISTFEEAKALPGIGDRLAEKIWEIAESGELRKLEELSSNEDIVVLELFQGVWGAGATTARSWIAQGFRTLEDLRTKANLTRHQKLGLEYYDDLQLRMSYEEAAEIEKFVREAALSINPELTVVGCGSYRRKKQTCGDVDVLVTHSDGKSHKGVFSKLLDKLKESGFLIADLVHHEECGNQKKYMGICKLHGEDKKHRRLDIIVVPYDEFACAVMYFTGSAHFNRSMRNLAKKMGMSLTEHSLNTDVIRLKGEKINKGRALPTPTEESIFKILGLPYRPPEERDH